jgi:hypothetical protein
MPDDSKTTSAIPALSDLELHKLCRRALQERPVDQAAWGACIDQLRAIGLEIRARTERRNAGC